ncbi:tetratricopeptide repeat protein [Fodinisporobacter ferrooxydans]|uniref:Tetratricopeptide repeat protein n=1 Tax=Fodinisporobacter ferrooxydans TaxID=2901836 RepID=A0ABY4CH55_9BACL|nr:tetratricopeptide repeat protein [Alicyclobacillaceae bacterium MYW30-H2]
MGKFFLFYIIWRITGNPILAIIVLLMIYYVVDRRYIGLLPSVLNPFRKRVRMSRLQKQLDINPHDMSAKYELAQAYIEARQPKRALELLQAMPASMQDSEDVLYHTGLCHLSLGDMEVGETLILRALALNSRLHYGEPYLKLATAFANVFPAKAMHWFEQFEADNFSSCECYYRKGLLHLQLGNRDKAKQEWKKCLEIYRTLPNFRKRSERRWVLAARLKLML